ncbi:heterokaryon incompatibility protein-domain-containing protein [Trametes punicea]|nr:heterokaryon incompatibility protein-domain-containing protein [Trametes punicea]
MRLLHTRTLQFELINDPRNIPYAILSHVWTKKDHLSPPEQSFRELQEIQNDYKDGPVPLDEPRLCPKIRDLCRTAQADGYEFAWLDTACIDKSSSAELQEAINSMYQWYSNANVCYAYLADVSCHSSPEKLRDEFRQSNWFRRGWTLQELIAPHTVIFLSAEWAVIGTKQRFAAEIEAVTNIDKDILTHQRTLETVSVAKRMSWASRRKTTRIEDEAYSLMGIFGVHMPTVYGVGALAFFRLQEEIYRQIPDDSIFAWGPIHDRGCDFTFSTFPQSSQPGSEEMAVGISALPETTDSDKRYLFAPYPKAFQDSSKFAPILRSELASRLPEAGVSYPTRTFTPFGFHARFPLVMASSPEVTQLSLAILACEDTDQPRSLLALPLRASRNLHGILENRRFDVGYQKGLQDIDEYDFRSRYGVHMRVVQHVRIVTLSETEYRNASRYIRDADIYIPSTPLGTFHEAHHGRKTRRTLYMPDGHAYLILAPWCKTLLSSHGYHIEARHGRPPHLTKDCSSKSFSLAPGLSLQLTILHGQDVVSRLTIGRCRCQHGQEQNFLSVVVEDSEKPHPIQHAFSLDHRVDDPDHLRSWRYHAGSMFKELPLGTRGRTADRKMHLRFTRGFGGGTETSDSIEPVHTSLMLSVDIDDDTFVTGTDYRPRWDNEGESNSSWFGWLLSGLSKTFVTGWKG